MLKRILNLPAAIIILALGAGMIWLSPKMRPNTDGFVTAPGQVAELVASTRNNSNALYPVVTFRDEGGQEQRFRSSSGSNPPRYQVGQQLEVLYNPARPQEAYINSDWDINGGAIILGWMGWLFITMGALLTLGALAALFKIGIIGALLMRK
jgi:Protein of unknown function (DUF3592)